MLSTVQIRQTIFFVIVLISMLFIATHSIIAQEDEDEEVFTQGEETTTSDEPQEDPIELFNRAQDAHSIGDLETALKLYEQAIEAMPEFPEAEYQRGTILQTMGKIADAEKAFRRAIELRQDWTLPIAELGALLVSKGEFIEAELQLDKAIRLNNMSFPAYVSLTELKIKTKASVEELKTLLGKLQYLTTKAKIPASIWAARGAIERSLGDREAAQTSIKRALAIDANNPEAIGEAIELALLSGDSKGAVRNAQKLSELFPYSTNIKILLARSYHQAGETTAALKVLDSINDPTEEVLKLKNVFALNGSDDIATLEKLLETDPKNVAALGRLCIVMRTVDPLKAFQYCQQASQLEPNEINHVIAGGAALVQLKKYAEAVTIFQKLLENSPENYTIRANLATALFQLERFEEAKKEYQWITQKQPNLAVAYYFLAISHDKLEEYLDAMANYQQFLRLADDSLQLEKERVTLRLPSLQTQIKHGKGKKRR